MRWRERPRAGCTVVTGTDHRATGDGASEKPRDHEQAGTNFYTWCVVGVRSVVSPCTRAAARTRSNRSIGGVDARSIRCLALYQRLFPAPCHNRMRVDRTVLLLWIRAAWPHPRVVGGERD